MPKDHRTALRKTTLPLVSLASSIAALTAFAAHADTGLNGQELGEFSTPQVVEALGIVGTGAPVGTQGIVGTGTLGIVGTGAPIETQGIVGTGTLGIVGTGAPVETQGIVGTGTLGIVGTGAPVETQGIVGTGTLGIVGTGAPVEAQGIVGTGTPIENLGIVGTGTLGIVGTGALGIVGTGKPGFDILRSFEGLADAFDPDNSLILFGPVDQLEDGAIIAMGQRISIADDGLLSQLVEGDLVAIFGDTSDATAVANRILKVRGRFVEGSTPVYVSGQASSNSLDNGDFLVGSITVQIGAAGVNPSAYEIAEGSRVRVAGSKHGNLIIAEALAK